MNENKITTQDGDPVALITGAARRIGAEIARHLHKNGYRIIIHCHHSLSDANQLAAELNQLRTNSAHVLSADLSCRESCEELIQQALSHDGPFQGRLDALINNASAFFPTPVEQVSTEQWHQLFSTNLLAPFTLSQLCIPALKQRAGCIINIADIHGQSPLKGYPVYSITKAGLLSMTQSLAKELAPEIRVNAVSPGAILWPEAEKNDGAKQQAIMAEIPLGRMGTTDEITRTVLFLLDNKYLTGQNINVDGGRAL